MGRNNGLRRYVGLIEPMAVQMTKAPAIANQAITIYLLSLGLLAKLSALSGFDRSLKLYMYSE